MAKENEPIIISLTSFPKRIHTLHLVIECLLRQTYINKRVILWLSKNQFPSCEIPVNLVPLCNRGLEVYFVEGDIRSHKKHYYVFNQFRDNLIFLVDDDLFYPSYIVEKSYEIYKKQGGHKLVVANYGRRINYSSNGEFQRYNTWKIAYGNSKDMFFGSGGGTLIRPVDLFSDVSNKNLFLKLTPLADDIWLNAMARLGGNKIIVTDNYYPMPVHIDNNEKLCTENMGENNMNDQQLNNIQEYYLQTFSIEVF